VLPFTDKHCFGGKRHPFTGQRVHKNQIARFSFRELKLTRDKRSALGQVVLYLKLQGFHGLELKKQLHKQTFALDPTRWTY
jgi:hypothetical protein